ncbi:MAG: glutamate racemase, partial [Candidatus Omnitrophica bacterium]|nr:glutamate racemase [Candidatus Omnitrophota bacterium]
MIKNQPIGIFDSGIGGLTVLSEVEKLMPNENIVYFGDTARVPYGNKSELIIKKFSVGNMLFLLQEKVKMVVVACNSSSALALDYLNDIFRIPIIGVIEAGINKALAVTSGKIG